MLDDKDKINVTNRFSGSVGYQIPDLNNLHRVFSAGETKLITMEELRKLAWLPGGMTLLNDYLVIKDDKAIAEIFNKNIEPEYFYTEEDVKKLLLEGSLDALIDCINFAPQGVIDLVKKLAVELPVNDVQKRETILKMLQFDVTKAIQINEETKEENNTDKPIRRLNETKSELNNEKKEVKRRTATGILDENKYSVVTK